ncbi:phage tail length tape measure family protein [Acetobacter sp. LMG 32666]|uniref:phage tail length tape measure family protein n=1 Tax=Acetobacter sp. LMG 32666 TaxID=2959295 RepID=UPI0030C87F85
MSIRVSQLIARLDDDFSAKARGIVQNADSMASSVAGADAAGQSLTSTFRKTGQTLDQFTQSTDGVEKAQTRLDAAYDRFSQKVMRAREELEQGAISQQKYNDILGTQANLYEKAEARETRNIETIRAKTEAITALAQAQAKASQEFYNGLTGVSVTSATGSDRYSDLTSAFDDADRVRAKLVPLAAAEQDYAKSVDEASGALAAGIITQKEYDAYAGKASKTLSRQKAALGGNAAAVKLTSFEMGILADETHKFFDQVLAGGNPLQAAFYQVPNMVQVMGGLDGALSRVGAAMTGPGGIAAAAVLAGAAIYKIGAYAEGEQEQLAQLSQHLRATRTDYADMAQQAEEAARTLKGNSDLSLDDSRTVVQTIVSVPTVDSSQIDRLTSDARDLAAVMGNTVPAAAKTMAEAIKDPAKAAQDFAQNGMPGFNAGFVLMVQHMQQAGNEAGALRSVLDRLEQNIKGAADQGLTPFQQAWKRLGDDMDGTGEAIRTTTQGIGNFFIAMGTTALNVVDEVITGFRKIPDEISSVGSSLWGGIKSAGGYLEGGVESGLNAVGATNMAHLMQQGSTANPTFSAPATGASSAAASAAEAVTAAQDKQKASTVGLAAEYAAWQKQMTNVMGTDSSLGGQIDEQRRHITALNAAIAATNKLHAAGQISDQEYAESIKSFNGQIQAANVALAGMRGPFAELIEQQNRAAQSASALTGYDRAMVEAAQQADDAARSLSGGMASASEKAVVQVTAARTLAAEYQTGTTVMERNTALQRQVAQAWLQGGQAATEATAYVQAYTEALDHYDEGTPAFEEAVRRRTAALVGQAHATSDINLSQQTSANNDQIAVLQAQTASLGKNDEARQKLINHMQAEQQLQREGRSLTEASSQAYLGSVDALSDATNAYQHQQAVLQDVTGEFSSMADTISDDVTQAFVQGSGAGVSFKSVLQGIESQIGSMLVKMALINPLLNSIDGGARSTLGDLSNVLSGSTGSSSSSTSSGFGGMFNSMSDWFSKTWGSGSSGANASGSSGASGSSSVADQVLNGIGSIFSSGGGSGSSSDPFSGFSGSGNFSGSGVSPSSSFSASGSGSGLSGGSASSGIMGSIGGGIAGFGMGYSVGTMASHLTGGGQGGKIGAAVGSTVGSVVGGIFGGPMGSMIGGTVLGAIGGIIGGLFNKTHYVWDTVSGRDGKLVISNVKTKHAKDNVSAGLQKQLDTINATLADVDITVGDGNYGRVGHYHKGDKKRSSSLESLLPGIDLETSDDTFAKALAGGMPDSVGSVSDWLSDITQLKQTADALDDLGVHVTKFNDAAHVTIDSFSGYTGDVAKMLSGLDGKEISVSALQTEVSTIKQLLDVTSSGSESIASQAADIQRQYENAARAAEQYGMDAQMLIDKGNTIAAQMLAAAKTQLDQADQSVQARYMAATGNQEGADLLNQQVSGDQEIQQLKDNWRSYLGDTYSDNATYQQQLTDLEKTLAAERLKIQQTYAGESLAQLEQYSSSALQSVTSVFSNLSSYVQGLETSSVSPLSVQDQYGAANDNLSLDYQKAMGGDYDALSRVQSDAQTYLTLAQQWDGSGTAYADDFQKVLTMLQSIGNLGSDTFTASLAKTLFQQNTDATLQVKTAIQNMEASINATLRQFTRVQAAKAA